ncbi:mannose 6-phosphate receptor domain-containing protein [Aspergillus violaceofuscus CBS 115571]|uniref:Mannose 6-phosphate receptor domain-containing protein n=1 Tax=Aspergillus violaceofuscus (strain CBS 115571) TaxID=1450538 RepID=A0A2V5H2I0_ASPV1|nr:mannose 6-phosphate receptor domain-containing protein [Aspergillus violaceofuscus CBS 115571]
MKPLSSSLLKLLFCVAAPLLPVYAASDSSGSKDSLSPCVVRSPTTGLFYDLNAISISPPPAEGEKPRKNAREGSWHAKGHDYGANFTVNICAPVLEDVKDVVGVESARWKNVSAYYKKEGKVYSIGQQASDPFFRGRKLVMNYTDGSPCPGDYLGNGSTHTKSTIMSFLCERDSPSSQATVSFVGTMDQCTYFFEVRSSAACGATAPIPPNQGLSPGGVFGIIALIAIAAYLVGGCAYQRTVMHQRGWRQCPNYSLWAGIVDFVKDMFVILLSSVGRLFRFNRSPTLGHTRASSYGRRGDLDAENRLIDQLDEEWDD